MKKVLFLIAFLFSLNVAAQKFTIVQFNAKWNSNNTAKIPSISGVDIKLAYLEDQPESIRSKIKAVPVIILYKDGHPIKQWNADLSFKLNITEQEIRKALLEASK